MKKKPKKRVSKKAARINLNSRVIWSRDERTHRLILIPNPYFSVTVDLDPR